MTNIKSTILKFLDKWNYTKKSIHCAKITINVVQDINLKIGWTDNDWDTFLNNLDVELELEDEYIRGNLWLTNGKVTTLDCYENFDFAEWSTIDIPFIPEVRYASRDEAQSDIDYEIRSNPHKVGIVVTQDDIKMLFTQNR